MTIPDWQPGSWLGYNTGSVRCFKWEDVRPDNLEIKMQDLLEHLYNLATGSVGRTGETMSRNYASEPRQRMDRPSPPTSSDESERNDATARPNV